jgi:hypothetical protein
METKGFMRGTLVMTDKGPMPIEAIKVGDMVLTSNNRFEKVVEIGKKQIAGHYRLQVQGSPATFVHGNQLFYVREMKRKWDNQSQLSERAFSEPTWKKAKDLTKKDFIMMGKVNKSTNTYNLNDDDCWLIGKFMIKNSVSIKNKTVTINIKEKYLEEVEKRTKHLDCTITKSKGYLKCLIKDEYFFNACMTSRLNKETIIPMALLYLPDKMQDTFLMSFSEDKGKFADEYYILKDSCNKLIYQIGIMVANINSYGGYSLFIDGEQSFRIQFKDNVPKSANFVRIDNRLWQPVRQLNEIKAHRGTSYTLVTEKNGSFNANNLICQ